MCQPDGGGAAHMTAASGAIVERQLPQPGSSRSKQSRESIMIVVLRSLVLGVVTQQTTSTSLPVLSAGQAAPDTPRCLAECLHQSAREAVSAGGAESCPESRS